MRHFKAPGKVHAQEESNASSAPSVRTVAAAPVGSDAKATSTLPLLLFIS